MRTVIEAGQTYRHKSRGGLVVIGAPHRADPDNAFHGRIVDPGTSRTPAGSEGLFHRDTLERDYELTGTTEVDRAWVEARLANPHRIKVLKVEEVKA